MILHLDLPTLTNGGLLIPLFIVAGAWLHWRLTTTDHHTKKGDQ